MNRIIILIIALSVTKFIYGQKTCDDSEFIFVETEIMPEPSPDLSDVEKLINREFKTLNCGLQEGDKFTVEFKINCEGQDFDYRTIKLNKEPFECGIAGYLQNTITWTVAKQRNKAVDFGGTLVFKVSNSRFILLSESINEVTKS